MILLKMLGWTKHMGGGESRPCSLKVLNGISTPYLSILSKSQSIRTLSKRSCYLIPMYIGASRPLLVLDGTNYHEINLCIM